MPHAGVFYSYLAVGLGRSRGVAGGLVALISYNAIQICLYGLLGASLTDVWPGAHLAWWGWTIIARTLVGGLGILPNQINTRGAGHPAGVRGRHDGAVRHRGVHPSAGRPAVTEWIGPPDDPVCPRHRRRAGFRHRRVSGI